MLLNGSSKFWLCHDVSFTARYLSVKKGVPETAGYLDPTVVDCSVVFTLVFSSFDKSLGRLVNDNIDHTRLNYLL